MSVDVLSELWWRVRRRPVGWWALTVLLATVTAATVAAGVDGATAGGRPVTVAVLTRDVPAGATLGAADVTWRSLPGGAVPADPASGRVVGRSARVPLVRGEVLVERRLAPAGTSATASLLPPGTRAVAVPATPQSAPPLEVGDLVDVVATFDVPAAPAHGDAPEQGVAAGETPSFAVARAALVVAVGDEAVTVAVGEEDALRVAFALARGTVALALVAPS